MRVDRTLFADGRAKDRPTSRGRETRARVEVVIAVTAVTLTALAVFGLALFTNRSAYSDDAYISFHYAQALARGDGLVYNPDHGPVEGYTNFLLVLVVAPFIKVGMDPLLVVRVWSVLSALALAAMVLVWCRRNGMPPTWSIVVGAITLVTSNIGLLCMTGLETVPFTALLFLAFTLYMSYQQPRCQPRGKPRSLFWSNLVAYLAFLLRPEAAILWVRSQSLR